MIHQKTPPFKPIIATSLAVALSVSISMGASITEEIKSPISFGDGTEDKITPIEFDSKDPAGSVKDSTAGLLFGEKGGLILHSDASIPSFESTKSNNVYGIYIRNTSNATLNATFSSNDNTFRKILITTPLKANGEAFVFKNAGTATLTNVGLVYGSVANGSENSAFGIYNALANGKYDFGTETTINVSGADAKGIVATDSMTATGKLTLNVTGDSATGIELENAKLDLDLSQGSTIGVTSKLSATGISLGDGSALAIGINSPTIEVGKLDTTTVTGINLKGTSTLNGDLIFAHIGNANSQTIGIKGTGTINGVGNIVFQTLEGKPSDATSTNSTTIINAEENLIFDGVGIIVSPDPTNTTNITNTTYGLYHNFSGAHQYSGNITFNVNGKDVNNNAIGLHLAKEISLESGQDGGGGKNANLTFNVKGAFGQKIKGGSAVGIQITESTLLQNLPWHQFKFDIQGGDSKGKGGSGGDAIGISLSLNPATSPAPNPTPPTSPLKIIFNGDIIGGSGCEICGTAGGKATGLAISGSNSLDLKSAEIRFNGKISAGRGIYKYPFEEYRSIYIIDATNADATTQTTFEFDEKTRIITGINPQDTSALKAIITHANDGGIYNLGTTTITSSTLQTTDTISQANGGDLTFLDLQGSSGLAGDITIIGQDALTLGKGGDVIGINIAKSNLILTGDSQKEAELKITAGSGAGEGQKGGDVIGLLLGENKTLNLQNQKLTFKLSARDGTGGKTGDATSVNGGNGGDGGSVIGIKGTGLINAIAPDTELTNIIPNQDISKIVFEGLEGGKGGAGGASGDANGIAGQNGKDGEAYVIDAGTGRLVFDSVSLIAFDDPFSPTEPNTAYGLYHATNAKYRGKLIFKNIQGSGNGNGDAIGLHLKKNIDLSEASLEFGDITGEKATALLIDSLPHDNSPSHDISGKKKIKFGNITGRSEATGLDITTNTNPIDLSGSTIEFGRIAGGGNNAFVIKTQNKLSLDETTKILVGTSQSANDAIITHRNSEGIYSFGTGTNKTTIEGKAQNLTALDLQGNSGIRGNLTLTNTTGSTTALKISGNSTLSNNGTISLTSNNGGNATGIEINTSTLNLSGTLTFDSIQAGNGAIGGNAIGIRTIGNNTITGDGKIIFKNLAQGSSTADDCDTGLANDKALIIDNLGHLTLDGVSIVASQTTPKENYGFYSDGDQNLGNLTILFNATPAKKGYQTGYGIGGSAEFKVASNKTLTLKAKRTDNTVSHKHYQAFNAPNLKAENNSKLIMENNSKLILESDGGTLSSLKVASGSTIMLSGDPSGRRYIAGKDDPFFYRSLKIQNLSSTDGSGATFVVLASGDRKAHIDSTGSKITKKVGLKDEIIEGGSDKIIIPRGFDITGVRKVNHTLQVGLRGINTDETIKNQYVVLAEVRGNTRSKNITFNGLLKSGESMQTKSYSGFDVATLTISRYDDFKSTDIEEEGSIGSGGSGTNTAYYYTDLKNLQDVGVNTNITSVTNSTLLGTNYLLMSANLNSLSKRLGELRNSDASQGVWGRIFAGSQKSDFGINQTTGYLTVQAGYDYNANLKSGTNYIGFALSYIAGSSTQAPSANLPSAIAKTQGAEVAIYNTYIANIGLYSDSIVKFGYLTSNIDISNTNGFGLDNFSVALSEEIGYKIAFGPSKEWVITPQLELAYGLINGNNTLNQMQDAWMKATQDAIHLLRSRVGVSWGYNFDHLSEQKAIKAGIYIGTHYAYDVNLGGTTTYLTNTGQTQHYKTLKNDGRFVLNIGTDVAIQDSAKFYVDFEKSFAGKTMQTDYQISAGVRYSFGSKTEAKKEKDKKSNLF